MEKRTVATINSTINEVKTTTYIIIVRIVEYDNRSNINNSMY